MFKTTPNNYKDNLKNIPWTNLPATFQNAITICRYLNIEHIWIDSLCIVQNEPDGADFIRESVRMCDYYGNSFLTISGTRSAGCSLPFLSPYVYRFGSINLPFGDDDVDVAVRRLTREQSSWSVSTPRPPPDSHESIHISMPILSRAWVFQENSLSRRVLHFLDHDVLYECRHSLSSHSGILPRGTQQQFDRIDSWRRTSGDPYNRWRWAIENYYFAMQLTHVSDRLPAMSGLAQDKFRQFHPPQILPIYLAGLWNVTLAQDLCWRMSNECGTVIEECYVAPSWSWASLRGESIMFMANWRTFIPSIRLTRNGIILKSQFAPFGEITIGSYISVYAAYRKMVMTMQSSVPSHSTCSAQTKDSGLKVGGGYNLSFPDEIAGVPADEFVVSLDSRWPHFPDGRRSLPVSAMLVGEQPGQLHGLVLEELPRSTDGHADCKVACRRIGYFWTRENHQKLTYDDEDKMKGRHFTERSDVMRRVKICRKEFLKRETTICLF